MSLEGRGYGYAAGRNGFMDLRTAIATTIEDYAKQIAKASETTKVYSSPGPPETLGALQGPDSMMTCVYSLGPDYRGHSEPREIAKINLCQLPGCCGVCMLYHMYVHTQRKGIGTLLLQCQMEAAKTAGYTWMQCTTIKGMESMEKMLNRAGFEVMTTFTSQRTRNDIKVWGKNLLQEAEKKVKKAKVEEPEVAVVGR